MLDALASLVVALWLLHPPAMTVLGLAGACGIGATLIYPRRGPSPAWSVQLGPGTARSSPDVLHPPPDHFRRRDEHADHPGTRSAA